MKNKDTINRNNFQPTWTWIVICLLTPIGWAFLGSACLYYITTGEKMPKALDEFTSIVIYGGCGVFLIAFSCVVLYLLYLGVMTDGSIVLKLITHPFGS